MTDPTGLDILGWDDFAAYLRNELGLDDTPLGKDTLVIDDLGLDSMGSLHLQVAIYDLVGSVAALDAIGEIATLDDAYTLYLTLRTGAHASS